MKQIEILVAGNIWLVVFVLLAIPTESSVAKKPREIRDIRQWIKDNVHLLVFLEHLQENQLRNETSWWSKAQHHSKTRNEIRNLKATFHSQQPDSEDNLIHQTELLKYQAHNLLHRIKKMKEMIRELNTFPPESSLQSKIQRDDVPPNLIDILPCIENSHQLSNFSQEHLDGVKNCTEEIIQDVILQKMRENQLTFELSFIVELASYFKHPNYTTVHSSLIQLLERKNQSQLNNAFPNHWTWMVHFVASLPTLSNKGKQLEIFFTRCGKHNDEIPFIHGGKDAERADHPWILEIEIGTGGEIGLNRNGTCTGFLISPHHLLTAAHCFKNVQDENEIRIRPSPLSVDYSAKSYKVHPHYTGSKEHPHDIAIVRLTSDVTLSPQLWPVCIVQGDHFELTGKEYIIAGYGHDDKGTNQRRTLKYAHANAISEWDCLRRIYPNKIRQHQFCIIGSDDKTENIYVPCQGDSGGPSLYGNDTKIATGIVSHGFDAVCKNAKNPVVYTSISPYFHWILEKVVTM